jgi:hypothetical protein
MRGNAGVGYDLEKGVSAGARLAEDVRWRT